VVTRKEIENKGAKTVDEALDTVVGAYAPRNISGGMMDSLANAAITLRGIPRAVNTLVMLDGFGINDSYSGSQRSALSIAPENVERIEIVRGPFSSLYGGNAMGGVVNVITRMPDKREFALKSGYGTAWDRGEAPDDVVTAYFSAGDRFWDRLSLYGSYGYKSTNGYPTDLNIQSTKPTTASGIKGAIPTQDPQGNNRFLIGDRGDKTWWDDNVTFKAKYDFSDTTNLRFLFTRAQFEYEYETPHTLLRDADGNEVWKYGTVREASFVSPGGKSGNEDLIYNLAFETEIAPVKIKANLGFLDRPLYYYTTPDATPLSTGARTATRAGGPGTINKTLAETYQGDLQCTVPLWGHQLLTVGGSYRQAWADTKRFLLGDWQDVDSITRTDYKAGGNERLIGAFLEDEIMILDNLTAYLGFRQDWWETSGGYFSQVKRSGAIASDIQYDTRSASAFSPKASIVYKPFETTTLRASAGQAFRPPTVYELYSIFISRGVTTTAGPNLEPETVTAWDVGVEQGLWKGAKVRATYFENYMEDLIYSQTVTPTLTERVNIGSAESRGVEFEIEQRFDKWLRLFSNFTITNAYVTENDAKPETVGKKLVQVPEFMFNNGVDFSWGPFSSSLVGRYVGKRYTNDENTDRFNNVYTSYDPYFLLDTRLSYKVTDFATVSLYVDNLLDRDYFSYYKAPGRSIFGEVSLKF
jgi:iron complex outermembrane recepter protein